MRRRVALILLALLGLGLLARPLRDRSMEHYLETQTYEDIYYLPPPQWLEVMSLGYRRALADLIWIRALIYFGDEFRHRGAVRHVFNYGNALLDLDPDFRRVYRWVGMAALYTPKGSPIEFVHRAVEVLRRGANRFPDDGELAWDAGATMMYELLPQLDAEDPERERLRAEATELMMVAAARGAAPDWLVLSNATQLSKLGETDRELQHLQQMYGIVSDPSVKQQIEMRIARLQDAAYAEAFRRVNAEFDERREKEFPYVPPGLFFFLEEPVRSGAGLDEDS